METFSEALRSLGDFVVETDARIDIVFTIDATKSIGPFINKIKDFILSFDTQLRNVFQYTSYVIKEFRVKIIIVHKYDEETNCIFKQSKFFKLPEEQKNFYDFVSRIEVYGVDDPKNGLEALALAMQSDFTKKGDRRRHVIILFTNNSAQIISQQIDDTDSKHDSNTHMNINTLYDIWKNINDYGKRIIMFAPDTNPWSEIESKFNNIPRIDISIIDDNLSVEDMFDLTYHYLANRFY